jgi:hypothetical protein
VNSFDRNILSRYINRLGSDGRIILKRTSKAYATVGLNDERECSSEILCSSVLVKYFVRVF